MPQLRPGAAKEIKFLRNNHNSASVGSLIVTNIQHKCNMVVIGETGEGREGAYENSISCSIFCKPTTTLKNILLTKRHTHTADKQ